MVYSHPYYENHARRRVDEHTVDALIQEVGRKVRLGLVRETDAITTLRAAGACEPEIDAILSVS